MTDVARTHGVKVVNEPFEQCSLPHGAFDLVCAGTAWHWIDPALGYHVAAALLRSGGRFAVFRNTYHYDKNLAGLFDAALQRHTPHLRDDCIPLGTVSHELLESRIQELAEQSGHFANATRRCFEYERQVPVGDWIHELETFSQIALLDLVTRERLLEELAREVANCAGARLWIRHRVPCIEATRR